MRPKYGATDSFRFLSDLAAQADLHDVPDAPDLAQLAVEHRMHGLATSALSSIQSDAARSLLSRLAGVDAQTWTRHRFMAKELGVVTTLLGEAGITHYLIKGLAVEHHYYGRRGERPSGDLDVVLAPGASLRVALEALGDPSVDISLAVRLAESGWIQAVDLHTPGGVPLDLHLDPLKLGFPSQFGHLVLSHLRPASIDGTEILTLDPTASLVLSLLHLNRNRFRHLSGFADVKRILDSPIDWEDFERLVDADGMDAIILSSMSVVTEVLDLSWPPRASHGSAAMRRRPRRIIWKLAWPPSTRLSGTAGRFRLGRRSQFLMPALCRGRLLWTVGWFLRRLFPPKDIVTWNHPETSGPYLWRLLYGRWERVRHNRIHRRSSPAPIAAQPPPPEESSQ